MDTPFLVGHRGYPAKYPENTLVSIEAALDAGAKYIEFDLQLMEDDVFLLSHDDNLRRLAGVSRSVFSLDTKALRNFQANDFERFKYKFENVRFARLDQVLSLLRQYPEAECMIEIKSETLRHYGNDKVLPLLISELKPVKDRCHIISFDFEALNYIKQHSDYRIGFVLPKYEESYRKIAEKMQPELLVCNYRKLPELTDQSREEILWPGEWEWMLYLMDAGEDILRYRDLGVRYIETDNIGEMLENSNFASTHFTHTSEEDNVV